VQITLEQAELEAYNLLNNQVRACSQELQRLKAARDSFIHLLEAKYQAVYNPAMSILEKPDPEPVKEE
tara:strand:+ start:1788 stop:1991 length:204 start_codon:yes stop_codon:yes gene_type:complete